MSKTYTCGGSKYLNVQEVLVVGDKTIIIHGPFPCIQKNLKEFRILVLKTKKGIVISDFRLAVKKSKLLSIESMEETLTGTEVEIWYTVGRTRNYVSIGL